MSKAIWAKSTMAAAGVLGILAASPSDAKNGQVSGIGHVLLISIDGFHAVDLANCTASGLCPNLARLGEHGSTYSNAVDDQAVGFLPRPLGAAHRRHVAEHRGVLR